MKKNSVTFAINPTKKYDVFSSQVDTEVSRLLEQGHFDKRIVETLLNGAAAEALEVHVSREARSADGIFFSGKVLSRYVASCIAEKLKAGATVADPACGAGDLLLACAAHFGPEGDVSGTVQQWGNRIIGFDLHDSFIDAAKARLTLLAATTKWPCQSSAPSTISPNPFGQVQRGNYFDHMEEIATVDCVVMNPPFATVQAPDDCSWASGSVQLAGLFLASLLAKAKDGQEIVAVLPDVLRSGTRYSRWRRFISSHALIKHIFVYGRFDQKTDVDVFVIHLTKGTSDGREFDFDCANWNNIKPTDTELTTLVQHFKVSVGAYVPFRAKKAAKQVDYLCVADAPADAKISVTGKCNFDGTLHKTPFVVIRRTSNPSDSRRVIPTLILGPSQVAVENHLIVLSPNDGSLKSCKKLLKALLHSEVDKWMNQAIRCRHLTTAIVKQLPLMGWK